MGLDKINGCKIYYNKYLEKVGMPIVFECTSDSMINTSNDRNKLVDETISIIRDQLQINISGELRDQAYMGKRFNLYMYSLNRDSSPLGELRLVEVSGYFLNISGVLFDRALDEIEKNVLKELIDGRDITIGYNMNEVFLEKSNYAGDLPYGQKYIRSFVIYAAEGIPNIDISRWKLRIKGEVSSELTIGYEELTKMSDELGTMNFHCVTGWSIKGKKWRGVRLRDLLDKAGYRTEGKWVLVASIGGYSTVLPMKEALAKDTFIIVQMDNNPLTRENGYPARLFNPRLYGWKSAKWISEIVILDRYIDGLWEALAYHERGYVHTEERFKVRNPLIAEMGALPVL